METSMTGRTFEAMERAGWTERAGRYDEAVSPLTGQTIQPLLDSLEPLRGARLLDVACGPGHLAAVAASRGAQAEGIDFAPTMIEQAKRLYPLLRFAEGDVHAVPFEDASFDVVACSFGLLHFADPERARSEVRRVLRPGGRFAFTVWSAPQQGNALFALVLSSIQQFGQLDVPLPPAPPIFRFADDDECRRTLSSAGFSSIRVATVPVEWRGDDTGELIANLYRSTVRTAMLLQAQSESARRAIHEAIAAGAERTRGMAGMRLEMPAVLVSAVAA
jgi:ubiquinone/menaquinone biosynthesis C-methylase UbiE